MVVLKTKETTGWRTPLSFKVQVLGAGAKEWMETNDIGDAALFVETKGSLRVSTREHPELRAGCVYYAAHGGVVVLSLKGGTVVEFVNLETSLPPDSQAWEQDGNAGGVFMSVVIAPRLPDAEGDSSVCHRKYLVASPGGRLMVVLKESKEETTDKYSRPRRTCSFKVQVLDGEQWRETDDIGDAALFVGVNSSLCMSTREHPELRVGCIYYTENDQGPCKDDEDNGAGVFSLKEGRAEKVEGLGRHRSWPPLAWFIPSIP
ncbi:hypothetical protein TRIUR3_13460 [Triticum urartu]|uniref:KIB1-4 beta-propeller domain-containing protein n=1 Tax=Triticum urartu TaxID=4572 RepID=M8A339_TRIUA|nr:hypothetical protein TRIUR3_13460 [Triticum urartu]